MITIDARHRLIPAVLALILGLTACGPKKAAQEPSAQEFAPYIKAFSGGVVAQDAPIRILLAEDASTAMTEDLFRFKPAVKGQVQWDDAQSVTFIPEEGALEVGKTYQVCFELGKVMPDAPEQFSFGITVKGKAAASAEDAEEPDNGEAFRVVKAVLRDNCVEITFNDAPANANVKGLVELTGVTRSYVQVQNAVVNVHFEGRRDEMTLTLDKGLKSQGGAALNQTFTRSWKQEEEKPAVEIPFQGNILPDKQQLILPFRAVNLSAVEVRVVKIYEKNILSFLQDNNLGEESALRRSGRLVYRGDVPLDANLDLHQWNTHCIDLSGLFKQEPGAIYRIRLCFRMDQSLYGGKPALRSTAAPDGKPDQADEKEWDIQENYYWDNFYDWSEYSWKDAEDPNTPSYYMDADRFPTVQLLSSDIGLMADFAGGKQLWVVATDLLTAKPMSGVHLEVFDYQLQSIGKGKTDSKGLATLNVEHKPFAVVAKAGGSTSYLKISGGTERSTSRFDVGGEVLKQGMKAFIYGERGVWRPGDTLHVTAIVADKGKTLPKDHPATLEVYTAEGSFHTKITRKGTDGFFSFDVPTREDDPTGFWSAYLKVGGSSFHKVLHVESVKPNRLKINTNYGPEDKALQAGTTLNVHTAAAWLSGGPAGQCQAQAELNLRRLSGAPFKGFEQYQFNNPASEFRNSSETLYRVRLDGNGEADVAVKLPEAEDAPGMLMATIVTSVTEPGGDESFTTDTRRYSPFSAYVGIRLPEGDYLETDKDQTIRLAVVNAEGQRVKGHKVEYYVFKAGWDWWWDDPGEELEAFLSGESVSEVTSGTFTSGSQDASVTIRVDYPDWGRFLVLARDMDSGHISGCFFTMDWPEYRGRANRKDPEALTMLSFSMDKPSYQAGEKATVFIPAAPGAQALITLENSNGILQREWVSLSDKDTPWSFTVTPEMAPNIYVQVTLLQPYGATVNDLPIRLWGVQRMKVEDPASHLEPVIQMPDKLHPEEPFQVKISEKNGKPMTYTLAIVDEGLLDLTGFKTPDPWSQLYKPEALSVNTWDLYDKVIGAFGAKMVPLSAIGGDEEVDLQARKDNRFNPVVLFHAPRTLEKGTDVLTLQLPMYVGSVRVMLIAGHDGAYGKQEKTVPVQNPLMVVTSLPRVLGTGEQLAVPVNVFAMEEGVKKATVKIQVDGPLALTGAASQQLSFSAPGDQLIRFGIQSSGEEGIAHLAIQAEGNGFKASENLAVEVRNAQPLVTRVDRFILEKGASKALVGASGATLQLAGFPAIDARELYIQLRDCPYDSGEQLSARGLAMLNLLPLLPAEEAQEAKDKITKLISRVYARQNSDGGFAYWNKSNSDSWVSSLSGLFLTQAAKDGYEVNSSVLASWKAYQEKMSKVYRIAGSSVFSHLDEAFRLYSLAAAGSPSLSAMNRLKEAGDIGYRAQWMLASAYALSGKQAQADALLDGITKEFPDYEPYNLCYGTAARDKFVALEALTLAGRVNEALALANDFVPDRLLSCQESAFAAIAYRRLLQLVPTQGIHVKLGNEDLTTAQSVMQAAVNEKLTLQNLSEGPLYATLCTPSREGVKKALSNGLKVDVQYLDENGAALNPAKLAQGTRFTAVVKVTNVMAGRHLGNLALQAPVPSGWEIINERLQGVEEAYDHKDIRDDKVLWYFALPAGRTKTFQLKLRAAFEGSYQLPSILVEAPYEPSVNACTASGTAIVSQ